MVASEDAGGELKNHSPATHMFYLFLTLLVLSTALSISAGVVVAVVAVVVVAVAEAVVGAVEAVSLQWIKQSAAEVSLLFLEPR